MRNYTDKKKIVTRHAYALFSVFKEHGKLDEAESNVVSLFNQVRTSARLKNALVSPFPKAEERIKAIEDELNGRVDELIINFCKTLAMYERSSFFKAILEEFISLVNQESGFKLATVVVSDKLSEEQYNALKNKLEDKFGCKIILSQRISKSMVGGMTVEVDSEILDASLNTIVNEFKKKAKEALT